MHCSHRVRIAFSYNSIQSSLVGVITSDVNRHFIDNLHMEDSCVEGSGDARQLPDQPAT